MAITGLTIRVIGHVQGVYFRQSTQRKARELGLSGFVRNEPDGSVTIEAEGDPEELARLAEWAAHGPPEAHVHRLVVDDRVPSGHSGFEIR